MASFPGGRDLTRVSLATGGTGERQVSRTEEEQKEADRLFAELRGEIEPRKLANAENLDRHLLSLSSAGLGLSVAFIKDVVPLKAACHLSALISSWMLFGVAILVTLASFIISQRAQDRQLAIGKAYYLDGDTEALRWPNRWARWTEGASHVSFAAFVAAVALTIFFVTANVVGARQMAKTVPTQKGAPVPTIQQTPRPQPKDGAPVPQLQPVKPGGGQGGGGNQGGGSGGAGGS